MCKIETILIHVSVLEFDVLLNKSMITEHTEEFNWNMSSKKLFTWFALNDILKTSLEKILCMVDFDIYFSPSTWTVYFLMSVWNNLSNLATYMRWHRSKCLFHFWFEDWLSLFFGYIHVSPILHSPWEGAAIMIKLVDTCWHIYI